MSAVLRGPKFHRRTLLKGLGAAGAMLLAPTVRRSVAHADVGDPNFVVFYSPNGSLREDFGADGTETAFTLRSSLAAHEPWRSRITVIHNI
ncbi:MAG: twin-arginine translocation signal domain-containing protein, partial [Sandaracinaceae bacterium]